MQYLHEAIAWKQTKYNSDPKVTVPIAAASMCMPTASGQALYLTLGEDKSHIYVFLCILYSFWSTVI